MKTDLRSIKNDNVRIGYEAALREYAEEIAIGKAVIDVLDKRYEFAKEDYE